MTTPILRVVPEKPIEYKTGPIYEYTGEPTILGRVTYRSAKGYNMTIDYGHIPVKMLDDGAEKFGGYYRIKQVKIVRDGLNEKFEVSERDGIMLPADKSVEDAIDSAEMLVEVSLQNLSSDEFDDE